MEVDELDLSAEQLIVIAPLSEPGDAHQPVDEGMAEANEMVDLGVAHELLLDGALLELDDQSLEDPGELPLEVSDCIHLEETPFPHAVSDSELFTFSDNDYAAEPELGELDLGEASPYSLISDFSFDAASSSAVRRGIDQQLDNEDTETHYNLGIAFKEMSLFDDAITEFQAASRDPGRKLDCIILEGMCCREKGDFGRAEEVLKKVLTGNVAGAENLSPLKYELALLYESTGNVEGAFALYSEIYAVAPSFRDTKEKLAGLQGETATAVMTISTCWSWKGKRSNNLPVQGHQQIERSDELYRSNEGIPVIGCRQRGERTGGFEHLHHGTV